MTTASDTTTMNREHQASIEALRPLAMALPATAVKVPDLPVPIFLDEGFGYVAAGREHLREALAGGDLATRLEQTGKQR